MLLSRYQQDRLGMQGKWSDKQDKKLLKLIEKHGTVDWNLILSLFRGGRSRDSLIKRWHSKLKYMASQTIQLSPERHKKIMPIACRINRDRDGPHHNDEESDSHMEDESVKHTLTRKLEEKEAREPRPNKMIQNDKPTDKMVDQKQEEKENEWKDWTEADDDKLRNLAVARHILDWQRLASEVNSEPNKAQLRWRHYIYPKIIKVDEKVGGVSKYTPEEDKIIEAGMKKGVGFTQLCKFLPARSEYSMESRWVLLSKPERWAELKGNRHYQMRQLMSRVVERKRNEKQAVPDDLDMQYKKSG